MELSAQDICELVKTAAERMIFVDLPSSKTGVKIRADKENWPSRQIQGKGGRGGI